LPQRKLNVGACRTDAFRGHGPTTGAYTAGPAAPSSDVRRFPLSVAWQQQLPRTLYVNFRMYLGALHEEVCNGCRRCWIDRNARLCGGYRALDRHAPVHWLLGPLFIVASVVTGFVFLYLIGLLIDS